MAHFIDRQSFETLVQSLLADGEVGSFGKIHIITIAHGSDEETWKRLLPKATTIVESVLHVRLRPEDACLKVEQGQYLLVFPRLSEKEGAIKAAAIAHEIRERLFGQSESAVEISASVLPLSRLQPRPAAAAVEAMDQVISLHQQKVAAGLDLLFQPVWDCRSERRIGNRARAHRSFGGQQLFEHEVLLAGANDPLAGDANERILQSMMPLRDGTGSLFVAQAINEYAMTDEGAVARDMARLALGRSAPVVVELAGGVAGVPHARLRRVIRVMRDAGVSVGVRTVPELESAKFLRDSGVEYLCLSVAQAKAAGLTPSALYAFFTVVAHEIGGLGFRLCLWNAISPADVKRAIALGFTLFSGGPIGPTGSLPIAPAAWPTAKVFA